MGRVRQILRLAVVLLVSLTAVESVTKWTVERKEHKEIATFQTELYKEVQRKCPNSPFNDENANRKLHSCFFTAVDFRALERVFVNPQDKKSEFDEVFRGFCDKRPALLNCVEPFSDALKNCSKDGKTLVKAVVKLAQSGCDKRARIVDFVAEGGVECYSDPGEAFQECIKKFLLPSPPTTLREVCGILPKVQECVIKELSHCPDRNLVPDFIYDAAKALDCPMKSLSFLRGGSANVHSSFFVALCIAPVLIFANNYFL